MPLGRRSEKVEMLKKVPLFGGLSQHHLRLIAREADEAKVDAGTVLVRQGGLGREFVLILDGKARVERDGKLITRVGRGEFFGEMSLVDRKTRSATVTAETPMVLLVIETRYFGTLLDTVPGLQKKILVTLCERLRAADADLAARN
jgi:CRP/FNR family cyclic AMP-dependent transcriptional regulator